MHFCKLQYCCIRESIVCTSGIAWQQLVRFICVQSSIQLAMHSFCEMVLVFFQSTRICCRLPTITLGHSPSLTPHLRTYWTSLKSSEYVVQYYPNLIHLLFFTTHSLLIHYSLTTLHSLTWLGYQKGDELPTNKPGAKYFYFCKKRSHRQEVMSFKTQTQN